MRKAVSLASLVGVSLTIAVGLVNSGAVSAKPLAPVPPLSGTGKQILAAEPGKVPKNPCPDAKAVGLPIYPHAYCITASYSTDPNSKVLPTIVLVSKRPPKAVHDWYAKHLGGAWQYNATIRAFVHPGWTVYRMMQEPAVRVLKANHGQHRPFRDQL